MAHDAGVPQCEGELDMRANFAAVPQVYPSRGPRAEGARRGAGRADPVTDPARDEA